MTTRFRYTALKRLHFSRNLKKRTSRYRTKSFHAEERKLEKKRKKELTKMEMVRRHSPMKIAW